MLAVVRALREEQLREPERLAGFVYGIARNLINNYLRTRSRLPREDSLEAALPSGEPARPGRRQRAHRAGPARARYPGFDRPPDPAADARGRPEAWRDWRPARADVRNRASPKVARPEENDRPCEKTVTNMSAKATNSSKSTMDCTRAAREEILERYLVGSLSDGGSRRVRKTLLRMRALLRCAADTRGHSARSCPGRAQTSTRTPTRRGPGMGPRGAGWRPRSSSPWGWWLWMRPRANGSLPRRRMSSCRHGRSPPEPPSFDDPIRRLRQGLRSNSSHGWNHHRYEPLRLRGVPDEATARFERGMERYRKADYCWSGRPICASPRTLDPEAAHIRFFLGISHLMLGQDDAGIDRLRATIALGDSAVSRRRALLPGEGVV